MPSPKMANSKAMHSQTKMGAAADDAGFLVGPPSPDDGNDVKWMRVQKTSSSSK
jgi:hypothetical protein